MSVFPSILYKPINKNLQYTSEHSIRSSKFNPVTSV